MLTTLRLILISFVFGTSLVACSNNNTDKMPIEAGMAEQAVADKLGSPTFSQSRTIDKLTFTQSEWSNEKGTTSVQFINGKSKYSQFTPTTK